MPIYRGPGGPGDATGDAASEALLVTTLAAAAQVSADNAAFYAGAATSSATDAYNSASAASTSATNASTSASSASTSASNASTSASSASTSATNAASSATTAASSATDSAASAALAQDWATKTSGTVAGGEYSAKYNAQLAATSASNASTSASSASTSATNAASSATSASSSASSASTSATNAANSATSAANSATAAAAVIPSQTGNSGKYLTTNGTSTSWATVTGGVTSVTGTSPVVSSGGTTPAISLASGYGDTQNPYASKTANYILAAPNGTSGAPTFRAMVAADVPTLNQNTTGSAATLTTGRTISISGDLTYTSPSFNGSGNVTAAGTLATVNSNVGSFGSSSSIPVVTVNAKGLVTAVSTATVAGGQYFGSAATKAIAYNSTTIAENITTTTGNNCLSVGPITVSSGYTVTIAAGQRWVIL